MINASNEELFVGGLAGAFPRSRAQKNVIGESDAELIGLPDGNCLALTTDTISEEIMTGLYADPYLAGWMIIMVNLSDLAAVGAEPLGCVVSEVIPSDCTDVFLSMLQKGIADAAAACGTFVLGGDTGSGKDLVLTGTATGICHRGRLITRMGCTPGDLLFSTDLLGGGNAFACQSLLFPPPVGEQKTIGYRPMARLREGFSLPGCASSCMDSSDGVLATLHQLARMNRVGFELDPDWISTLKPEAAALAVRTGIPEWMFLAGEHGEFELLFTVPPAMVTELYCRADSGGWHPVQLGRVTEDEVIRMTLDGRSVQVDTVRLRNAAYKSPGDIKGYFNELMKIDDEMRKGVYHEQGIF